MLFVPSLPAQEKKPAQANPSLLTLDRIHKSGDFNGDGFGPTQWLSKAKGYTTLEDSAKVKGSQDIVRHDPETGKKDVLVSAEHLYARDNGQAARSPLHIESYAWSPDEALVLIFTNSRRVWRQNTRGDYYLFDISSRELRKLGGKDARPSSLMFAKFAPDGKKIAWVSERNIHVEDLTTRQIVQLTRSETPTIINGTFDWVYEEELDLRDGFRWSPDSTLIAFWQLDTSKVKDYYLVNDTAALYQKLTKFPYPKAGEINSAGRIGVVGIDGKAAIRWLDVPGDRRDHYIARMDWAPTTAMDKDQIILLQQLNRLQNTNKVILANLTNPYPSPDNSVAVLNPPPPIPVKVILTEQDKCWVDMYDSPSWFGDGKRFTWLSERDGWRHLHAVARDGGKVQLLTKGDFDVIDQPIVREKSGWSYFYASPENATQKYLYRAKLDGSGQEKVTPETFKGWNSYDISPDGTWAIHTHSSFSTPPVVRLVRLDGHEEVRVLSANKKQHENVNKLKRGPAEFFKIDIGDGVQLDGWVMKPPSFDPARKYPVLFYVYGEPAAQTVLDQWSRGNYLWHLLLTQQGYVVVSVDNRGTPAPRGREFRKYIYRRLGEVTPRDQAAAARALLKQWPWLDPQRVAVWGWSGGGTMSLHLIFRYGDIYKAAMAVAPVSNERYYDSIYQERYMGLPKDNVQGYREGSALTYAAKLQGNLLIVHGTGDDNVHYANTEAVVNELIAANKQFTMMAYPNRSHGISEGTNTRRHLFGLLTGYLNRHVAPGEKERKEEAAR
jgi:dipeptidyl-peptidase-4